MTAAFLSFKAVIILGFAALISGQYAPPFQANPPIPPAQEYGPPKLAPPAHLYGLPAPPPSFAALVPPLVPSESNLVPPQFSPPSPISGSLAQTGFLSGFASPVSNAGAQTSTSALTNSGGFSFAASPHFTAVPAPPSSQYGTPSFKK